MEVGVFRVNHKEARYYYNECLKSKSKGTGIGTAHEVHMVEEVESRPCMIMGDLDP